MYQDSGTATMKKFVLIVEDEEPTRASFAHVLRRAGWDVTEAADGDAQLAQGKAYVHDWNVQSLQTCSTCHR